MINIPQFRQYILIPTLKAMGEDEKLYSKAAANLIIGTGLVESNFMDIKQLGIKSPIIGGLGYFQCELETATWLLYDFLRLKKHSGLLSSLETLYPGINKYTTPVIIDKLLCDIKFGVILCRLKYLSIPAPIPSNANDIEALAAYWKEYYNASTSPQARPASDFVRKYRTYVKDAND